MCTTSMMQRFNEVKGLSQSQEVGIRVTEESGAVVFTWKPVPNWIMGALSHVLVYVVLFAIVLGVLRLPPSGPVTALIAFIIFMVVLLPIEKRYGSIPVILAALAATGIALILGESAYPITGKIPLVAGVMWYGWRVVHAFEFVRHPADIELFRVGLLDGNILINGKGMEKNTLNVDDIDCFLAYRPASLQYDDVSLRGIFAICQNGLVLKLGTFGLRGFAGSSSALLILGHTCGRPVIQLDEHERRLRKCDLSGFGMTRSSDGSLSVSETDRAILLKEGKALYVPGSPVAFPRSVI